MIKNISGVFWFCCPQCEKKLFQVFPDAVCHGVYTKCSRCAWTGEINIKEQDTQWQVLGKFKGKQVTVTK